MQRFLVVQTISLLFGFCIICTGLPTLDFDLDKDSSEIVDVTQFPIIDNSTGNKTSRKNLYVVKAVVYEVGILTDSSDENETSSESQERVDLTFFDAHRKNNSKIDLGRIPLPIQTNVSGQVLTGIAPFHIGAFSHPSEILDALPLSGTIVNITHSDTAYFQLQERNASDISDVHILQPLDISQIPNVGEVLPEVVNHPEVIKVKLQKTKT